MPRNICTYNIPTTLHLPSESSQSFWKVVFFEMWPKNNMCHDLLGALFKMQIPEYLSGVKEPDSLQMDRDMELTCKHILIILIHTKASHNLKTSMDPG